MKDHESDFGKGREGKGREGIFDAKVLPTR